MMASAAVAAPTLTTHWRRWWLQELRGSGPQDRAPSALHRV